MRLIVDGKIIYTLDAGKPVIIPITNKKSKLVVSDGYHVSKPVDVVFYPKDVYHYRVICAVDDNKLATGVVILVLFYLVGITSDEFILKLLSFIPVICFLYYYYINRKEFIQIQPVV